MSQAGEGLRVRGKAVTNRKSTFASAGGCEHPPSELRREQMANLELKQKQELVAGERKVLLCVF